MLPRENSYNSSGHFTTQDNATKKIKQYEHLSCNLNEGDLIINFLLPSYPTFLRHIKQKIYVTQRTYLKRQPVYIVG